MIRAKHSTHRSCGQRGKANTCGGYDSAARHGRVVYHAAKLMRLFLRFLDTFPPADRAKAAVLVVAMTFGALLESVGIGLVMPFLALFLEPAAAVQGRTLARLYHSMGSPSLTAFTISFGVAVLGVSLTKNAYLAALSFFQYRFLMRRQLRTASRLVASYLRQPYAFFLQRNSALLLRNAAQEIEMVFMFTVVPMATLLTEAIIALAIVALLFVLAPLPAMAAVAIFGGIGAVFYTSIRKRLSRTGEVAHAARGDVIRWLNQAFGSVKETKVLQREEYFCRRYDDAYRFYTKELATFRFLSDIPRLGIETLAVATLVAIAAVSLLTGHAGRAIIPTLGVFALAAMRLMACVNRIVTGLASSRHGTASLQAVFDDLAASQQALPPAKVAAGEALELKRAIEFREVRFRYAGADRMSLDGVSATIPAKSTVALVGHSGAGKTTLVDLLLGLHETGSGEILIDGQSLGTVLPRWQRSVGYIPQSVFLLDDTIRRNVAFGVEDKEIADERVWAALRIARLDGFVRTSEHGLDTIIGEHGAWLSGGERQRVGIARALYHDPPVLILDEATAALDNATEREFQEALAAISADKTVIVIAHRLSTVKRASHILLFAHGKIVASGKYAGLASSDAEFQRLVRAGEFEPSAQAAAQ